MCMVVFHTIFALSEQLSGQQFLRIFSDWLQDFPDVDLPMPTEDTMESVSADGSARLTSCQTSTYIGLQLSYEKEDVQYQHTYIRTVWHDIPVLYAHVEGSFLSGAKKRPLSWEVPGFVQRLFWEECAGEDHGIPTDDKAWVLRRQQVPLAQDILSRKLELLNPVVYLSPNQQTGEYAFDYERLARKLRGIAHVLVEGSPLVSKEVKRAVPDAPTDGETSVIFPGVEEQRFAFPDEGSQKEIFDQIVKLQDDLRNIRETTELIQTIRDTNQYNGNDSVELDPQVVTAKIDALVDVFESREGTYQQMLSVYEKMYDDVTGKSTEQE